jgi:Ca2+-binding EF-hand superfamily protein
MGGGYGGQPGGGGGYGQPAVDPQIAQWFNAVDTDRSGQIDASELQRALVNGNWSNFSEESCRMMIDMFDANRSGTIDVQEFSQLYSYISSWKSEFEKQDNDRSGRIDEDELARALEQMGYRFSPTFISNILAKYDPRGRRLTLDNFIVSNVQIKRLTDSFRSRDKEMRGTATLAYEDFIGIAMGAHK